MATFEEICDFVLKYASIDQLDRLNNLQRTRRDYLSHVSAMAFNIGDKVSFDAGSKGMQYGRIIKINNKTIKIDCFGLVWNVEPSLLKKYDGEIIAR